jgi:cytochrome c
MRIARLTVAVAIVAAASAYAQDRPRTAYRVARDGGCMTCHDVESPERGVQAVIPTAPAFQDIACRYRSDPDAASRLSSIVREGSGPLRRDRHWTGQVAFTTMYPNDLVVTEAEARQIVDWIMTLCPKSGHGDERRAKRG